MEAEPKSASLTWPGSVSRMLPAFTSLRERERVCESERVCERERTSQHVDKWRDVVFTVAS